MTEGMLDKVWVQGTVMDPRTREISRTSAEHSGAVVAARIVPSGGWQPQSLAILVAGTGVAWMLCMAFLASFLVFA